MVKEDAGKSRPENEAEEIARHLHSSCLRLLRRLRLVDEKLGMSTARMSVLSVLVFKGPCSPSELASIEQVSKPTITNLIKGLEKDGFVHPKQSKTDKRSVVIHASAKGKRLLKKGQDNRVHTLMDMLAELSPEDSKCLQQAAKIIESVLTDH